MNPKYVWSDEESTFIGTFKDSENDDIDVYITDSTQLIADKSIIARFGEDEDDYTSYPVKVLQEVLTMVKASDSDALLFKYFSEALLIAEERDLI